MVIDYGLVQRQLDTLVVEMSLEEINAALKVEITQLESDKTQLIESLDHWRRLAEARPKLISPSEYARLHRTSVSTVNRACNGELGYRFEGFTEARAVGQRQNGQPVVRWYIDPAARIVHTKTGKGG